MKKKILLTLALVMLASFVLTACDTDTPNEYTPTEEETPEVTLIVEEPPNEYESPEESNEPENSNEPEESVAPQAETSAPATASASDDIKAQMAGNWRGAAGSPANATLMNLYADGSWESPGPLPTDMTIGGSFVIISEDAGIHHLMLIIEHTCDHPAGHHIEIGSEFPEFGGFKYDAANDRLGMSVPAEGNTFQTVWLTR